MINTKRWAPLLGLPLAMGLFGCHGSRAADGVRPAPGFNLAVAPASMSIPAGGSGVVVVTVSRFNGFADPVTLRLSGGPPGLSAGATVLAGVSSASMVILVGAELAPQSLNGLSVTGQAGPLSNSTPLALTVVPALPLGSLSPDRVQASGGPQSAMGIQNHALVQEPIPATAAQDASGSTRVRHGFSPSTPNQNP